MSNKKSKSAKTATSTKKATSFKTTTSSKKTTSRKKATASKPVSAKTSSTSYKSFKENLPPDYYQIYEKVEVSTGSKSNPKSASFPANYDHQMAQYKVQLAVEHGVFKVERFKVDPSKLQRQPASKVMPQYACDHVFDCVRRQPDHYTLNSDMLNKLNSNEE